MQAGEQVTHWDKTNKEKHHFKIIQAFVCLLPARLMFPAWRFCTTQMASNKGLLPLYGKSLKMFCTQLAIGTMASFYYFDQNPFRFRFSFHIWILLSQRSLNKKSPNLHKIAKPWWILAVVLKWRHVFTSSRHGYFTLRLTRRLGRCCVDLHFGNILGDEFWPRFLCDLVIANERGYNVSKTVAGVIRHNTDQVPGSTLI